MGAAKKYPVNACGVRDDLSGDMLASSRYKSSCLLLCTLLNFVISVGSYTSINKFKLIN